MDKKKYKKLQKRREYKKFKRKKKNFHGNVFLKEQKFKKKIDSIKIDKFQSELYEFLKRKKFVEDSNKVSNHIKIPKKFSLYENYNSTLKIIELFTSSISKLEFKELVIDFSNCIQVDQPALFLFQVIWKEFNEEIKKLKYALIYKNDFTNINVISSKKSSVNKLLFVAGFIKQTNVKDEKLKPVNTIGYFKGIKSQKNYTENRKSLIAGKLVGYINSCLKEIGFAFSEKGTNYFDGLISEILNNAEDHSPMNTYYVTANFMREFDSMKIKNDEIGELNLSILNFGDSYYEGLIDTKSKNIEIMHQMEQLYNKVNIKENTVFNKENLFTLYALQDGMSRLKFEDESRGTGTMAFINSFFLLGDYENHFKNYYPSLKIFTGNTFLKCDNTFKPFEIDGVNFLSLNSNNDLSTKPENSHLINNDKYFPGTILHIKIYLNNNHILNKIDEENN